MKYTKAQQLMVDDGFPPQLFMTDQERKAAWKANPPKPIDWQRQEAQARLKREAEMRKQQEALKKVAEKSASVSSDKGEPEKINTEGLRWDINKSQWVPDKFALLAGPAKKTVPAEKPKKAAGNIFQQFGVGEGSNREKLLKALVANKAAPASIEKLAKATYGVKGKEGPCAMVMKGLIDTITKKDLPYGIEKSAAGYLLFEA